MAKIYVLDTSVLLYDPDSLSNFDDNNIVIPFAALAELDNKKSKPGQIGYNARQVSRILDNLSSQNHGLRNFFPYEKGSIKITGTSTEFLNKNIPFELQTESLYKDIEIIATALKEQSESKDEVILVSKDSNVRIIGRQCGVITEDYRRARIENTSELWQPKELDIEDELYSNIMSNHIDKLPQVFIDQEYVCNDYVTIKNYNESKSGLVRILDNGIMAIGKTKHNPYGIEAKNREQIFALNALMDESIDILTLSGTTGSGKTLLAIAAGLDQVEQGVYDKIIVMRSIVSVGKDLGTLPGFVDEKVGPYMKAIYDNIDFMIQSENKSPIKPHEYLIQSGKIEIEAFALIRGRSINNAFIIVDEAQNSTKLELKTAISRAGKGTKIVITGDINQIDNNYLDRDSCGLTHVAKAFRGQVNAAHVNLIKAERSRLSEQSDMLL